MHLNDLALGKYVCQVLLYHAYQKKDALLNGSFNYKNLKKLIKILHHFKALWKYFHLAPIWYFYLFSFRNGISLSKNVACFSFAIPM